MGIIGLLQDAFQSDATTSEIFIRVFVYILSMLSVIFLTLPVHEFAHGLTAFKLGDPTPRYQGRLTVNPFAHIDYLGAACILLLGFGWAKPVQINARNFKNPKAGMAITALAGPVANLIMALICLLFDNLFFFLWLRYSVPALYYALLFFYFIAQINVYLAVFNLIPIPPLDGSRLLAAFLPTKQYFALMRYERYIFFGLLALIWFGVLDAPLNFLAGNLLSGLNTLAGLPFRLL